MDVSAVVLLWVLALPSAAWAEPQTEGTAAGSDGIAWTNEPIQPIQPIAPATTTHKKRARLGEQLFFDTRLSPDGSTSCASCHNLKAGGADGKARSVRPGGQPTEVNTPSLFNVALNARLFWDGRVETLEEQLQGHTQDIGSEWSAIRARLAQNPGYTRAFADSYPEGMTTANLQDALATFERSLLTPDARFDRYLRGDATAITAEEKEGYRLFKVYGCASCHQGVNAGGNMFQKVGVMGDYFAVRGNVQPADLGYLNVTGLERDRYMFRVPGLRNVALTAPYLHDGNVKTLEAAVKGMSKFMLGRPIEPNEIDLIVKFLGTLSGEYQGRRL